MRGPIAFLCGVAMLVPGPGGFGGVALAHTAPDAGAAPFCRTPGPLPDLGPERTVSGNGQQPPVVSPPMEMATRTDGLAPPPPPPAPPPPPPTAMATAAPDDAGTVVVTGSRAVGRDGADTPMREESADSRMMPPYPPRPPYPPQPRPQSGLLTAGEHDDLLNPELYAAYQHRSDLGQQARGLPRLDTARLFTVEVRDSRGQATPFETVELRCADGNALSLKTVADGRVVFFPDVDRLSDRVWVRAGVSAWRTATLSRDPGGQVLTITASHDAQAVKKLDLALVIDVTGSMGDEIRYLQAELESIIAALEHRHPELDIRIGFTFYRDKGDDFVTRTVAFDGDVAQAQAELAQQSANGGGDYEEAMQDALIRAAGLDWRPDAVKSLLLVADAPPHDDDIATAWLAAEHLRASRVQIVPVGASGVGDMAEYVMRAMAAATQSRYTFLTDDSGIGNRHAKPAIDCYLVTRLDQLLRRVIDSQISGRRIEPEQGEVIRSVGQYDAGRCILPPDFGQEQD